jgi:hypothetical protein
MSKVWYVVKRIAHALGWLWILAIPTAVVMDIATGLLADPQSMPDAWLKVGVLSKISVVVESVVVCGIIVSAVLVWIAAIRRRWSLKWPLIVVVVLSWPFGFWWITAIGVGKLIIHAFGRGGDFAGSDLVEPVITDARPRGMVEYASYE